MIKGERPTFSGVEVVKQRCEEIDRDPGTSTLVGVLVAG